jgi:hypothetical protein
MTGVIAGLLYLAASLAAFACYGAALRRVLLPALRPEAGLDIALGIALYTALCGLLEITQSASRPLLLGFTFLGAAAQLVILLRTRRIPDATRLRALSPLALLAYATFAALYALFLLNAARWRYVFIDDVLGYLVFPERILAEGSLGRDPFNFRRIEAGLAGGGGYLYALFRAALDLHQTRLADVGTGSACLLLLVAAHARDLGLAGLRRALLLLLALATVVFSPLINNTPETVAKALLFAMLRLAWLQDAHPAAPRRAAAFGLLAFALVALKVSHLPGAVAVLAAIVIARAATDPAPRLARDLAVTLAAALLCMLPWMLVSHAIAGTFWYPVLGVGTLSPDETAGIATPAVYLKETGRLAALLAPALVVALAAWSSPALRPHRRLLAALSLCTLSLTLATQLKYTAYGYRYGHADAVALMLFALPIATRCRPTALIRIALPATIALALAVMVRSDSQGPRWLDNGALRHRPDPEDIPALTAEARTLQQAIPPGQPFLAVLAWPAGLDFRRNPIAVMDHPGTMGPPIMPPPDDPTAWATYLRRLGYRYVAFAYSGNGFFSDDWAQQFITHFSERSIASPFLVASFRAELAMRESLNALRGLGALVYDDGTNFVVRLD